jgi:membrane protease YdiL (CAAX protease family)
METAPPSFGLDVHALPLPTLIGMLLALALSAGIVEEVAFRGYLQKMLEEAYGLIPALAVTGVAFWFAHSDKVLLSHLPFHMLASVLLGVAVYLARSLWPAVVGHALGDAVLQPAYVFQKPEFVWTLLNARPIWDGRAETSSERLSLIWQAIHPSRLFEAGPDRLAAAVFWIFALSLIVAVLALVRLGRVAASERQESVK